METSAEEACIADVNRDGRPDVVIVDDGIGGRRIQALLGDGQGGFVAAPHTPYFANDPDDVAVADINGDGHLDVAFPDFGQRVFYGDGTGAFGPMVSFTDPVSRWLSLDYGDLDGDGNVDAVGGRRSDRALVVQFGDGAGGFEAPIVAGDAQEAVFVADVDDDGRLDFVGASFSWRAYINEGDRSFVPSQTFAPIPASFAQITDVDGDGLVDFVGSSDGYGAVGVARQSGFGDFLPATYFGTGHFPGAIVVEDLDGDGDRDLALLDDGSQQFTIFMNRAR